MIHCREVYKTFIQRGREVLALDDINLFLEGGEFVMITGDRGAGKSTLLSLLGGLILPTKGTILIDDEDISTLSFDQRSALLRQKVGLVSHKFNLMEDLTVLDNVSLPLCFEGLDAKLIVEKSVDILDQLGIRDKKDHLVGELLNAEREMVSIARALIHEPKIILLDEPVHFLDHASLVKVMTFLRQMVLERQILVVTVIHDVRVYPFATKIIEMNKGKIESVMGEDGSILQNTPFLEL